MEAVEQTTYILFSVAGATYALPSHVVKHVEIAEAITRVPDAPPFVDGVVFTRGLVVPVVNLRARFGFERTPLTLQTRLIVVEHGVRVVGLLADSAREFIRIPPAGIHPPHDAIAGDSGRYLDGVASIGNRLILILGLEPLLQLIQPAVDA